MSNAAPDTTPRRQPGVDLSYCADEVRRHDPDRFLTALFAAPDRREALFALYAFNLEIAKTREVVTDATLGRIRLQWWRESLDGIYDGTPRQHQVIQPLAAAVAAHELPRGPFDAMIDGRERDLEEGAPPTLADLEAYCADTSGALMQQALAVLGVTGAVADAAARPAGIAHALVGLARAVPFHAQQRRVYLPTQVVEAVAADMGDLFELKPHAGLQRAVERLAEAARGHLAQARAAAKAVPGAAMPALLPARVARSHLAELKGAGYDPFKIDPRRRPGLLVPQLWLARRLRRI